MNSPLPASASPRDNAPDISRPRSSMQDRNRWGAVVLVAAATFIVVAAEMMPVGLLTPMSGSLRESEGTVGLSLTITGVAAAVTAPFVPIVTGRIDRRSTLIALMTLVAAANALTAIAPSFLILAIARVILGVSMGGVWALAASLAPKLVSSRSLGLATTIIFSGIAVASVLGVPVGTFIGDAVNWNAAFWVLAAAATAIALAMAIVLPEMPSTTTIPLGALALAFRNPGVRAGLAITALLVIVHFAAYTYVRPALETFGGFAPAVIGTMLLIYGDLGILGNFVAGPISSRNSKVVAIGLSLGIAGVLALFPSVAITPVAAAISMAMWGFVYGGVSVTTQTWIAQASPEQREAVSALWVSVFNASIAFGAFTGGRWLDGTGPAQVFWINAGIALLAVLVAVTCAPRRAS
ncbi:MFS transporter [Microbacterium oxydans]|nr:MFS transporter [Microbacterium oxydans]